MADTLRQAVRDGNERAVADVLKGMPEPERRTHAEIFLKRVQGDQPYQQMRAAQLALIGTGTLTEFRRAGAWIFHGEIEFVVEVLLDRRPPWLQPLADWVIEGQFAYARLVRALIAAGAVERPDTNGYLDALLRSTIMAEEVAQDELWELLAHNGELSVRNADDNRDAGFHRVVVERVREGRMDRDRVLDLLLAMLGADLSTYTAGWYMAMWRELAPTEAERDARLDALVALLAAAAKPIVSFAVDELLKSDQPVPPAQLAPALTAKAKKTAKGALKLLDRDPDAEIAAIALGHEAAEVQKEALDRLEAWGGARGAILEHLDLLAGTQRPRAEALLGISLNEPDAVEPVEVEHIPEPIRQALNFGGPVPEAPVPGEPVLGDRLEPFTSLDELAAALAEALPTRAFGDLRAYDAILRRCDDRSPFDGPLKPFVERLHGLKDHTPGLAAVARAWLTGETPKRAPLLVPWAESAVAAGRRAARGEAGPLLALPTHAGGWIEPKVFLERLAVNDRHDEWDLAEAVLRLAPDGREEALDAIEHRPTGAVAEAVRAARDPDWIQARFGAGLSLEYITPKLTHGPLSIHVKNDVWPGDGNPYTWPQRRDLACASALASLAWALAFQTQDSVAWTLEPLLDPYQPLAPTTLRLVLLALCSSTERDHLVATDLLIAAIEDGRVDAHALIPHLRADLGLVMTTRLAPRLATIAQAGPLHRAVVRDTVDGLTAGLADLPARRRNPLLRLLEELRAQGGEPEVERALLLAARVRRAQRWIG